jgi:beta-phosphoglucomutase-like phosphatase (HAD superfamily)
MTRTQAIVFDMDGVLIDSEELHAHAKRIAFARAVGVYRWDISLLLGISD